MKHISPMELTTLLNRSKQSVVNLSFPERVFISFLLARVNKDKLSTHGYLAWPGAEQITEYTGLSKPTIERCRKSLVIAGWMQYTPGHGAGSSNHYYVNGAKILACYVESGNKAPEGVAYRTNVQEKSKEPHKKNTSGLMKGNVPPRPVAPPIVPGKPIDSKPGLNPDGSPPFFPNGARRYTKDDIMPVMDDSPEEPSIPVQKVNYFEEDLDIPF